MTNTSDCSYDPNTSQWGYNTTVKEESVYYYDFAGPLIPGIYYLVVTFDGFTSESSRLYNGQVTLPVVRAAAVKLPKSLDPSGHLIITWTPGNELFQLGPQPTPGFIRRSTPSSPSIARGIITPTSWSGCRLTWAGSLFRTPW